jgi:hypothetical protein
MNGYKSLIPRVALGSIAAAMSAITIGSLVVLPAKFDHVRVDLRALAAMNPVKVDARAASSREEHVDPDFVRLETQASPAKPHKSSSHS